MQYEVIERLARGGMGIVDLAVDDEGNRVALKRLVLVGTTEEMQRARLRFEREREVLDTLDHPAIVPLVDVLDDDDGEVVLVMPYLEGGNLASRVQEHGPLPASEAKAIARRLLPALAAAHRAGVVHRDIKPGNILFDDRGRPYLADFGVALTSESTPGLTQTGIVLGTPGFLAPEQARGEPVTAASDIASLGATIYFAATGASPYGTGDPHAVLLRTARGKPELRKDLDPWLDRLIRPMLDPKPERRPTAASLAGGPDGTTMLPATSRRWDAKRWITIGSIAAGLAVFLLATTGGGGDGDVVATDATTSEPAATTDPTTTTEPECIPLPYHPCDGEIAPNTNGRVCIDDHADYDGDRLNGCEAAPDAADGRPLVDRISANIVPASDEDRFAMEIRDEADFGCNNTFTVSLTAPTGVTLRMTMLDRDDEPIEEAIAADGSVAEISVSDPRCLRDDGGTYEVTIEAVGSDRTADDYVLTRRGSF